MRGTGLSRHGSCRGDPPTFLEGAWRRRRPSGCGWVGSVTQPRNVHHYEGADLFEIAAAYAYHIAEAQAYLDGNKRTAIACALIFLECNGIETTEIDPMELYQPMIDISAHRLDRKGLAARFRELFA